MDLSSWDTRWTRCGCEDLPDLPQSTQDAGRAIQQNRSSLLASAAPPSGPGPARAAAGFAVVADEDARAIKTRSTGFFRPPSRKRMVHGSGRGRDLTQLADKTPSSIPGTGSTGHARWPGGDEPAH